MLSADQLNAHLAAINEVGYSVIEDVFDSERAAAFGGDLDRLEKTLDVKPSHNQFEGAATVRIYNLLVHGKLYEDIPVNEQVLAVVEGVIGSGCLVSSLSSISICPGETPQPIHADDQLLPLAKPHAPTVCNSMWALTNFTEANGATRVVPASHLADSSPQYGSHYDSVACSMKAGSVLVWHGSLWHGGGGNNTRDRRVGIAMNYCAGWIRQQENQQLGIPHKVARGFSPRLQELVGYGIYNGLIGHINKRDPAELLGEPGAAGADGRSALVWDADGSS